MKRLFTIAMIVILLIFSGCSDLATAKPAAEAAVLKFHNKYNTGDFKSIFENADQDFKKGVSFDNFILFMKAVHSKLGKVKSTENQNWRVGNFNLKTFVSLQQKTEFEKGIAVESFNYRIENEKAILVGYNINSRDLIIK